MTSPYKYNPIPDEPRYRKKAKKVRMRSDHRHEYEEVAVNAGGIYCIATRCKVCGRLYDFKTKRSVNEVPDGLPLYKAESIVQLWKERRLD